MPLFLIFLLIPIIEIALFIEIGGFLGLWPTLAIVVLTAFFGTVLVRREGARALNDLRMSLNSLRDPSKPLADGAMILVAGALLLTPGFFTDAVGFALLVPQVRSWAFNLLKAKFRVVNVESRGGYQRPGSPGTVIDGDYEEVSDVEEGRRGNSGWTRH